MQLDAFNGDAFSMHELTGTFIKTPHQPLRLGALKLFHEDGVRSVNIDIEGKNGQLSLIQTSERGGPGSVIGKDARNMRTFKVLHFERDAKVYADEVQGIRAFGSETELQSLQGIVQERLNTLRPMHEVTLEYHRVNAIRGYILDADGTTIKNLFTEFGVSQQTHNFAFTTATTDVRAQIVAAKRKAETELGGLVISGWRAFCSAEWFDAMTGHKTVTDSLASQESKTNRADIRDGFHFAGVDFEEYRGSVAKPDGSGDAAFIEADVAYLVPIVAGSPILITRFGPADFEETVNTKGLPLYAKQLPDPSGKGKYRLITTQSNPICLNLRPRAVIKLTKS